MIGKLVLLALAIGKRNANNFYGMGGTAGLHYLLLLRIILIKKLLFNRGLHNGRHELQLYQCID